MNGQDIIHFQIKTIITWTSLCEDHDTDLIKHWISIQGDKERGRLSPLGRLTGNNRRKGTIDPVVFVVPDLMCT